MTLQKLVHDPIIQGNDLIFKGSWRLWGYEILTHSQMDADLRLLNSSMVLGV